MLMHLFWTHFPDLTPTVGLSPQRMESLGPAPLVHFIHRILIDLAGAYMSGNSASVYSAINRGQMEAAYSIGNDQCHLWRIPPAPCQLAGIYQNSLVGMLCGINLGFGIIKLRRYRKTNTVNHRCSLRLWLQRSSSGVIPCWEAGRLSLEKRINQYATEVE